jgi:hypothetical protein
MKVDTTSSDSQGEMMIGWEVENTLHRIIFMTENKHDVSEFYITYYSISNDKPHANYSELLPSLFTIAYPLDNCIASIYSC